MRPDGYETEERSIQPVGGFTLDSVTGLPVAQTSINGAVPVTASASLGGAVTPSDSTVLSFRALYVGGAGNVSIDLTEGGAAVVFVGVSAGTILPVCGTRVNASTTATNIVWLGW